MLPFTLVGTDSSSAFSSCPDPCGGISWRFHGSNEGCWVVRSPLHRSYATQSSWASFDCRVHPSRRCCPQFRVSGEFCLPCPICFQSRCILRHVSEYGWNSHRFRVLLQEDNFSLDNSAPALTLSLSLRLPASLALSALLSVLTVHSQWDTKVFPKLLMRESTMVSQRDLLLPCYN